MTIQEALQQAVQEHRKGNLSQAEQLYRAVLQADPNNANAAHNLGQIAMQCDRSDMALPLFEKALNLQPESASFWKSAIHALFEAGRFQTAGELSERYLAQCPLDADALAEHMRILMAQVKTTTVVATQDQLKKQAKACIEKAASLSGDSQNVLCNLARWNFSEKNVPQAIHYAQAAFAANPAHPDSRLLMASAELAQNNHDKAEALLQSLLTLRPRHAEARATRGLVRLHAKQYNEALEDFKAALILKPHMVDVHKAIASLRLKNYDYKGAADALEKLLHHCPDNALVMCELGECKRHLYQYDQSLAILQRATALAPEKFESWVSLAITLIEMGYDDEGQNALQKAQELAPNNPLILLNLGLLFAKKGIWDMAYANARHAVRLEPRNSAFLHILGQASIKLRKSPRKVFALGKLLMRIAPQKGHSLFQAFSQEAGQLEAARLHCMDALRLHPNNAEQTFALGRIEHDLHLYAEAETHFAAALKLKPQWPSAMSGLMFVRSYLPISPEARVHDAREYNRMVQKTIHGKYTEWNCARDAAILRIGFVSGDFRQHPVSILLEDMLAQLHEHGLETYLYATGGEGDAVTDRLRAGATNWCDISDLSDRMAAAQIHSDAVHILFDLSGHTNYHRLPMFARKPAPVQVTWTGYFATTGIAEMDYILGDPFVTPQAEAAHFTEKIWQLPECYYCFSTNHLTAPDTASPYPANGHITFGCFNNLSKVNDTVIAVWARILLAVPDAVLLLKTKLLGSSEVAKATQQRFAAHGVTPERIHCEGASPYNELLAAYNQIDIALDPFPYPGGVTTCEALWMGVPVLGMCGNNFLSHVPETLLRNTGMSEWLAADADEYVAKAIRFAADPQALVTMRATQRDRLRSTPLFNTQRMARNFSAAMRAMWHTCQTGADHA